jgi:hypothetical protein
MDAVSDAVYALTDAGVHVLSPADPRVVDQFGDFLFVASDRVRAIKLVQSRHLAAIEASDFLWLVAPEGYVGQSAAMELGYAVAVGTPVFCSEVPVDLTLRQYVRTPGTPAEAVREILRVRRGELTPEDWPHVLLDPPTVLETAHADLEQIGRELTRPRPGAASAVADAAERLETRVARLVRQR